MLAAGVDHVSAYALIVEDGTALARRVARGEVPAPDDDVAAARYELIDDAADGGGSALVRGVELGVVDGGALPAQPRVLARRRLVGRWARARTRTWPGRRWWNVKHPARYAALLAAGESPEAGREELTEAERATERVMLRLRLASGLPLDLLDDARPRRGGPGGRGRPARPGRAWPRAGAVLTRRGRLLADAVVHALLAGTPRSPPRLMRESAPSPARVGTFAGASRHVRQRESHVARREWARCAACRGRLAANVRLAERSGRA